MNLVRFRIMALSLLLGVPMVSHALCEHAWDGDQVASAVAGRPAHLLVPLHDRQKRVVATPTVGQIQAFTNAKDGIYQVAGMSPQYIICGDPNVNAHAGGRNGGEVVIVTVGMLRMVDGDTDMAAAVLGHELAHHTKQHVGSGQARDALITLAGVLLGAAVEARQQRRTGLYTGLGARLGHAGATLITRKFSRDQEREADDVGFEYMVRAGFDPNGAIRFHEKIKHLTGPGLFFDSHPGSEERAERIRVMIANNAEAQRLAARGPTSVASVTSASSAIRAPLREVSVSGVQQSLTGVPTTAIAGSAIKSGVGDDYRDMMTAVMLSDQKAVSEFLSRGVDINERQKGSTYLIAAVLNGDMDMVGFLISKGADVNLPDNRGVLPILYAKTSWPTNIQLSELLEKAGAQNPYAERRDKTQNRHGGIEALQFESYQLQ